MLKIGTVSSATGKEYSVVWYADNKFNERIDIIEDIEKYDLVNTSNCAASYIKGSDERFFGDRNLLNSVVNTRLKASMLFTAENRNVAVEDGKFVMTISKSNESGTCEYCTRMVNGKTDTEMFRADGILYEVNVVTDQMYDASDKPVNWEEYEVADTLAVPMKGDTVKVGQAEYYSYEELLRKYPQVTHVLENDYVVAGSYEEAEERLKTWIESKEQLKSFDIESYSLDWGPDSDNRITGIFLGFGETWSTYFPFRQQNFKYNLPIEYLRKIFDAINSQPPAPEVILIAHNVKFEIEGFYQEYRERIRFDVDTYLLSVLINPIIRKGTHDLKSLTAKVDGKFYLTLNMIFIGPVMFNVLTEEIVKLYGCPDVTSPVKIYKHMMQQLPKDEKFVMQLEMRLPYIKAIHNEFYGMRMDMPKLNTLIDEEQYKVDMLKDLFCRTHHTSKNINSYDVMSEILYYKLKCPVDVVTDKGLPATSKVAIDRILEIGSQDIDENAIIPADIKGKNGKTVIEGKALAKNKYPSLIVYQAYKKCTKELGALNRLKNHTVNGFFKFYINQSGAGSSRQTSDAHQFSDTMKSCAIADSPHHYLISCDWMQVELRILAGMARQLDLMELESDPGVDIHRAICSIIKKTPMYLISEEDRKKAKPVNFGVVYMMSEYGLARREYGPKYTKSQLAEVRKRIMDFFNGLPCVKEFIHNNEVFLRKNGFIKTAFCYYRYFKELLDPTIDEKTAMRLIRAGNNTPVQGTGAGMMKIVETKIDDFMLEKGWLKEKDYDGRMLPMARMILPIHDEILGSFDKEIPMEEIIKMFRECMELDIQGMPPFFAAPAFVNNWKDGKNPAYEIPIEFRNEILERYENGIMTLTGQDYLKVLTEYRNSEIREYMNGLVAKYKTVDEIAAHVTHDSLTHTLIEAMMPDKDVRKRYTHTERIRESVKIYLEKLERDGELASVMNVIDADEDDTELISANDYMESYARIDAEGNFIEEEMSEEDKEYWGVEEENYFTEDYATGIEVPRVMYLMNECVIDLTGIDMKIAERINQRIQKLSTKGAYYSVVYVIDTHTINTGFKLGYIEDEIMNVFKEELEVKE